MPDKKHHLEQHLDEVRQLLLEPRGVLVHSASIVLPSQPPDPLCRPVVASSLVIGHGHHGR